MSFVLDALKLSEQRRSRSGRRIYAHPPRPRRAGRGRGWLIALGVPAAIAVAVAGWRLVAPASGPLSASIAADSGGAPPSSALPAGRAAAVGQPSAASQDNGTSDGPAPSNAAKMGAHGEHGQAAGANPSASGEHEPARAASGAGPQHGRSSHITASASAAPDGGAARSPVPQTAPAQEVLAAAPPDWPALSLQMLFFSEEESRRFVQVNGKTYRQGEQLAAGPQVVRITNDGVTLAYRGKLLLLGAER